MVELWGLEFAPFHQNVYPLLPDNTAKIVYMTTDHYNTGKFCNEIEGGRE